MPTLTYTAGAMSKVARNMPSGTIARAGYFSAVMGGQSITPNLTRAQFCKIPNHASICYLAEEHSSTFTDLTAASFASTVTLKVLTDDAFDARPLFVGGPDHATNFATPSLLRENGTVLIPDTPTPQITQYAVLQAGYTINHSHSLGANIALKGWLNVIYTMDGF